MGITRDAYGLSLARGSAQSGRLWVARLQQPRKSSRSGALAVSGGVAVAMTERDACLSLSL